MKARHTGQSRDFLGKPAPSALLLGIAVAAIAVIAGNYLRSLNGSGITDPVFNLLFIDHWTSTQYFFQYSDLGFSRRTLIGSILNIEQGAPAFGRMFALLVACALVVALGFARLLADERLSTRVILMITPALFVQMGYDLGRFDLINTTLLMGFVLLGARYLVVFAILMLLIHEGAIATHIPMLFLISWLVHGLGRGLFVSLGVTFAALVLLVVLATDLPTDEMVAIYPGLNEDALAIFSQSVRTNITISVYRVLGMEMWEAFRFALCGLYLIVLALPLIKTGRYLPLLLCLAPLALSPVALDYARWLSLCCLNVILITLIATRDEERPAGWAYALLPFTLLGPIGVFFPLPMLDLVFG